MHRICQTSLSGKQRYITKKNVATRLYHTDNVYESETLAPHDIPIILMVLQNDVEVFKWLKTYSHVCLWYSPAPRGIFQYSEQCHHNLGLQLQTQMQHKLIFEFQKSVNVQMKACKIKKPRSTKMIDPKWLTNVQIDTIFLLQQLMYPEGRRWKHLVSGAVVIKSRVSLHVKANIRSISCGLTNLKSNRNMSKFDCKCSSVHTYRLSQSKFPTQVSEGRRYVFSQGGRIGYPAWLDVRPSNLRTVNTAWL